MGYMSSNGTPPDTVPAYAAAFGIAVVICVVLVVLGFFIFGGS